MLPTDDNFKRLTELQKNILWLGWTQLPSSDQIKKYYDKKSDDPLVTSDDAVNFKKLGYSSAQIKRMKEELGKAGFNQKQ